jgi:ABC-2 type transport system ATP-binding protein
MTQLIEAEGLTVRFGKVTALDGLDLTAPRGQVLAVLGPNGAGKTTMVRTIATLIRPDAGSLRVLGNDVAADPGRARRDLGLAGQFAAVEPTMTGRENLVMTARLFGHDRRAARAAAATVVEMLGLGSVANRRSEAYSGGQRRRLDLGASLVGAPRLLLLDEPTTGLDPVSRRDVWDAVRGLVGRGTDVLLTTHYLEEADELADQVVVVDHGRVVAAGPLASLKASIGRDLVEIRVGGDSELTPLVAVVGRVLGDTAVQMDRVARRVSWPCPGGTRLLAAVIAALASAGIEVEEIGLRRPTLDEVFAALTGDDMERTAA